MFLLWWKMKKARFNRIYNSRSNLWIEKAIYAKFPFCNTIPAGCLLFIFCRFHSPYFYETYCCVRHQNTKANSFCCWISNANFSPIEKAQGKLVAFRALEQYNSQPFLFVVTEMMRIWGFNWQNGWPLKGKRDEKTKNNGNQRTLLIWKCFAS